MNKQMDAMMAEMESLSKISGLTRRTLQKATESLRNNVEGVSGLGVGVEWVGKEF